MHIIVVDIFRSTPAFRNAIPRVNPSAHLWQTTAPEIAKHGIIYYCRPIASPSKTACIPVYLYLYIYYLLLSIICKAPIYHRLIYLNYYYLFRFSTKNVHQVWDYLKYLMVVFNHLLHLLYFNPRELLYVNPRENVYGKPLLFLYIKSKRMIRLL